MLEKGHLATAYGSHTPTKVVGRSTRVGRLAPPPHTNHHTLEVADTAAVVAVLSGFTAFYPNKLPDDFIILFVAHRVSMKNAQTPSVFE